MAETDDQIVKILIQYGLNDDAARQAVARMNEIKSTAGDMNTSLPEGTKLWDKYKDKLGEVGEETMSVREKTHILHGLIRAFGPEFEGVGHLAPLLFNPMTMGLGAVLVGVTLVKKAMDGWDEQLKKVTEVNALEQFGVDSKEACEDLGKTLDDLGDKLLRLANAQETLKEKTSDALDILRAQSAATEKVNAAWEKQAEQAIRLRAAIQGWSKEQLDAALSQIKLSSESKAMDAELAEKRKELDILKKEQKDQTTKSNADTVTTSTAQYNLIQATGAVNQIQKQVDGLIASAKARDELAASRNQVLDKAAADADRSIADKERADAGVLQGGSLQRAKDAQTQAQKDYDAVSKSAEETATRLKELETQIPKLTEQVKILADQNEELKRANAATAGEANREELIKVLKDSGKSRDQIISEGAGAIDAFQHGQKLTQQQENSATLLRQLFTAVYGNTNNLVSIVQTAHAQHLSLAQEIQRLKQVIEQDTHNRQ